MPIHFDRQKLQLKKPVIRQGGWYNKLAGPALQQLWRHTLIEIKVGRARLEQDPPAALVNEG